MEHETQISDFEYVEELDIGSFGKVDLVIHKKIKAKSKEILYPEQRKFYGNWLKKTKYEVNVSDNKNSFINK